MTKVRNILISLYEAKTYKNHITKKCKANLENNIRVAIQSPLGADEILDDEGIKNADDMIDFIEKHFKRSRKFNILSEYVPITVKYLGQTFGRERHVALKFVSFITKVEQWIEIILTYHKLRILDVLKPDQNDPNNVNLMTMLDITVKYKHHLVDESGFYKKGYAKILYEDSKIKVIKINTFKASEHFSSGSRGRSKPWCISTREADWNRYNQESFSWIFLLVKESSEKYAIDVNRGFAWDSTNTVRPFSNIVKKYPILSNFVTDAETIKDSFLKIIKQTLMKNYLFYRSYGTAVIFKGDKLFLRLLIKIESFTTMDSLKSNANDVFKDIEKEVNYPLSYTFIDSQGDLIFAEYEISS